MLDDLKWPCYKSLCGLHISIDTLTQLPDSICDPESALTQLSLKGCSSLEDLPAWLEAAKLEVRFVLVDRAAMISMRSLVATLHVSVFDNALPRGPMCCQLQHWIDSMRNSALVLGSQLGQNHHE